MTSRIGIMWIAGGIGVDEVGLRMKVMHHPFQAICPPSQPLYNSTKTNNSGRVSTSIADLTFLTIFPVYL